jgi:hypothetical protein
LLVLLGVGTTLGVVLQAVALVPAMRRTHLRLRFRWNPHDPAIRMIVRLSGWTFGFVLANQIALFVVLALEFHVGTGAVSAYTYAYATLGEIFAWIIGWDLTLEYAMGASTVSSGWSNHFIELLNIFHIRMPLWLAYDHWTGLHTAEDLVARQMAQLSDPTLVPGTQAFLAKKSAIMVAQSPELLQRAHTLLSAPHLFGYEIGLNLPAFIIALVITASLFVIELIGGFYANSLALLADAAHLQETFGAKLDVVTVEEQARI